MNFTELLEKYQAVVAENNSLKEELKKRDELLAGYLKQIEIQEEFIQKQKEMIEYLEDHISKITDIISGV